MVITNAAETQDYDRMAELRAFDESKLCVKGPVDLNSPSIPRFFVHPPESRVIPTMGPPTIDSVKAFNEQQHAEKAPYYRRDQTTGVAFASNFDLYQTKAASWRDTLQVILGPVSVGRRGYQGSGDPDGFIIRGLRVRL
ncbi:hypothetical protein AMTRI_Chr03g52120 [Amborella trichopoda]